MTKWLQLLVICTTLLVLGIIVASGIHLAMGIHHTLLLFSLGGLFAYALDPLVEKLSELPVGRSGQTLSRHVSVAIVFLVLIALVSAGACILEGHLQAQVTSLAHDMPGYRARIFTLAARYDRSLSARGLHASITHTLNHPPQDVAAVAQNAGRQAIPIVGHFFKSVGEGVIVVLIALYFLIFAHEMREKFNALLPEDLGKRVDLWETDVNRILGSFVRGQLVIAIITGIAAGLFCLLLGMRPWLLIGLFVSIVALIPVFGPYIGAIPAIIVALIGPTHILHGPAAAVAVLIWFIIINETGSKVLYPKLVGAALGLHTVFVLFVLFAGLEIDGVVGVLFAAPLTALIIVTVVHVYRLWQDLPDSLLSDVTRKSGKIEAQQPAE